jgi:hypothetical protein
MRHLVGLGLVTLAAMLAGCAGARTQVQAPSDVFAVMDKELAQTLTNGDSLDAMNDELSHAIGTTSLTSEVMLGPMPLPESRMSLAEEAKPAIQTWGIAKVEVAEIPATRDQ